MTVAAVALAVSAPGLQTSAHAAIIQSVTVERTMNGATGGRDADAVVGAAADDITRIMHANDTILLGYESAFRLVVGSDVDHPGSSEGLGARFSDPLNLSSSAVLGPIALQPVTPVPTAVPEPSMLVMCAIGAAAARRRAVMRRPADIATATANGTARAVRAGGVLLLAITMWGRPALAGADVVLDWNTVMVTTVSGQNPFAQGRLAAITQLAVFEAVNAITGEYRPYLRAVPASPHASPQAAAVAAAHTTLRHYVPAAAAILDAARAASLATIPDGRWKARGIAVGEAAASAIIEARAHDGSAPPEFHVPGSVEPGEWQLTPSCPAAGGILLHWRRVTPFGIAHAGQFRSAPPPALSSRTYTRDYDEVKEVGEINSLARPSNRAVVARFYNVVLAVATWNPAVRQAAAARRMSLTDNARVLALLNMAISDALVSVMETKYQYNVWRPETAIRAGDVDGNPQTEADAGFVPFIPAPCFPSYGSAHAAASYAARRVAERVFGEDGTPIVLSHPALPETVLYYDSFEEITDDIDDARVYGGIHFRFDQRAGAKQGRQIGDWISTHHLRPARGRHPH